MPVAAVESFNLDVRHHPGAFFSVDCRTLEPQAEPSSHRAMAAVAPGQEAGPHYFTSRECGLHSVLILRERHERLAELDVAAQSAQTLAQNRFRSCLRQHPKAWIR